MCYGVAYVQICLSVFLVLVLFLIFLFLNPRSRLSWLLSALQHTLNMLYCIGLYRTKFAKVTGKHFGLALLHCNQAIQAHRSHSLKVTSQHHCIRYVPIALHMLHAWIFNEHCWTEISDMWTYEYDVAATGALFRSTYFTWSYDDCSYDYIQRHLYSVENYCRTLSRYYLCSHLGLPSDQCLYVVSLCTLTFV